MTGWLRLPRRLAVWPVVLAGEAALVAAGPLVLAAAGLVCLARRDARALRVSALVLVWAAGEPYAMLRIARLRGGGAGREQWAEFVRWFVSVLYAALRVLLDVRLQLDPGSVPAEQVGQVPLVVLSRHSGPGDPFLLGWLLAVHYRLRLTVVAKAALRLEPAVDLAGEAAGLCFVGGFAAGRGRAAAAISGAATRLGPGEALLIFPEGANFSRDRRAAALERLRRAGRWLKLRRAARMRRVLPPRTAGTAAALAAAPRAAVLLVAHSGFGRPGRPWWRLPVHETVLVRTWLLAAAEVPREPAAVDRWLLDCWDRLDGWLASGDARGPGRPPGAARGGAFVPRGGQAGG